MSRALPNVEDIDLNRSYLIQVLVPALMFVDLVRIAKARRVPMKDLVYEALKVILERNRKGGL